jgi:hypothetical protein
MAAKIGHNRAPLIWEGESSMFADMRYSKSQRGMFVTFFRGGDLQYCFSMSRSEAREFMDSDSAGSYFNDYVREPTGGKKK